MFHRRIAAWGCLTVLCTLAGNSRSWSAESIIINEIHYDPDVKVEQVEFIELFNKGAVPVDVGGWSFTEGVSYVFPAGTAIPAGEFLVVAQDPADFQAKFGFLPLGPWSGRLDNDGEEIELRNAPGEVVDRVDYQLGFPWPTVGGEPGFSIELAHPDLDNDLGGNWRPSVVGDFVPPTGIDLVAPESTWKYFRGTEEASSPDTGAWRQVVFDDGDWPAGQAPFFYEDGSGYTGNTDLGGQGVPGGMRGNHSTVYFRHGFFVADPARYSELELDTRIDDGCVVWINGTEVDRVNIGAGEIPYDGTAPNSAEPSTSTVTLRNLAGLLQTGDNVLAVHGVNQGLSTSSDFLVQVSLKAFEGAATGNGPSPGGVNVVLTNNVAPQLRQVNHRPSRPRAGEIVTLTAKATDPQGVSRLTLLYQLVDPGQYIELSDPAYETQWTSVPMTDEGTGGDETGGDDIYTVQLPGDLQTHRRLVRYRIVAEDATGLSVQAPYADDPQPNFAYFVYDGIPAWQGSIRPGAEPVLSFPAEEMSRLPAIHLISKRSEVETATWFERHRSLNDPVRRLYQWNGTLVFNGEIYDHVQFRPRGGTWRYAMVKNMWKFKFYRGHRFQARDNWGRKFKTKWNRLNLGASIQQGNFNHRGEQGMFESAGFRLFDLAGVEAPHTTFVTLRIIDEAEESFPGNQFEGDFWGVYLILENMDGNFLDEHDLPDGNFYKMDNSQVGAGGGDLENQGPFQVTDNSDLASFTGTYNGSNQSDQWWRDNLDLDRYFSYQAILQGIHHYDICCGKNYYYYHNPLTDKWQVHPWDLDLIWSDNMFVGGVSGGTEPFRSRVLSDFSTSPARPAIMLEFKNRVRELRDLLFNEEQVYRLLDEYAALLQGAGGGPTVLDADRAMWDYNPKMTSGTYSTDPGSKAGQGRFYQAGIPNQDFDGMVQKMKDYIPYRSEAANLGGPGGGLDGLALDNQIPATPVISYVGPGGFPLNDLQFRTGNYSGVNAFAALKWRIAEVTPMDAPAARPETPNKYEIETTWESGEITTFSSDITVPSSEVRAGSTYRVRCRFKDATGRWSRWSSPIEFVAGQPAAAAQMLAYLRITELMYHAPAGSEFDYVELHNLSPDIVLDLQGAKFTQGIEYQFGPGDALAPGGYLLMINHPDAAAFRAHYGVGAGVPTLGPYEGNLSNGGETLTLRTAPGGTDIASFAYGDGRGWPLTADGTGHSLVPLLVDGNSQSNGQLNYGGNWRASTHLLGSPGQADPAPADPVVLNEVTAHTDFLSALDSNDWIELHNRGAEAFEFGPGWYLSDDASPTNLTKWMIPPGTILPARGWISFDEQTGFHNPTNTGFGLNKGGEQVLLSYLPGNGEDRVVDSVRFKGQENDWSLGRHPDGGEWWAALRPRTRDAANEAPPAGAVISEIMYHPPDLAGGLDNEADEFLEIFNPTDEAVAFHNTNGTWRLDGTVDFAFPSNVVLAAGSYLLVVSFDPDEGAQSDAFRSVYGLTDPSLALYGPYQGKLNNSSERVALEKPQAPDLPEDGVSWVIVDEVIYADQAPWPGGADGLGPSLHRLDAGRAGNAPDNWVGAGPSPVGAYAGGTSPVITLQPEPASRVVRAGTMLRYSVEAAGDEPLGYLWILNGDPIPGATQPTYSIDFATPPDSGFYRVVVLNPAGSAVSEEVSLLVTTPPRILSQPESAVVELEASITLTVTATGSGDLAYQWQRNGLNLPRATNSFLQIDNIREEDDGSYQVVVSDMNGAVISDTARLTVLVPPRILQQPVSQSVVAGGDVTFSIQSAGTLPMGYRWRRGSFTVTNEVVDSHFHFLTLRNVQSTDANVYTVVLTNQAFHSPGLLSARATLTVLMDTDGDGMADDWEESFGLNPADPADAGLDLDGDGLTNGQEHEAGTDPSDPASYLKIETITPDFTSAGTISLTFEAVTNRTYSVEFSDGLRPGLWRKLLDVAGAPTNRVLTVIDQPFAIPEERYYRLVTPRSE